MPPRNHGREHAAPPRRDQNEGALVAWGPGGIPRSLRQRVVIVSRAELVVSDSEHACYLNYKIYKSYYISLDLFLRVEHEYNNKK